MNKKQFIEATANYPDTMELFLYNPDAEFKYQPLEFVSKKKIGFSEEPEGKILAKETVIVLSDPYNPKP